MKGRALPRACAKAAPSAPLAHVFSTWTACSPPFCSLLMNPDEPQLLISLEASPPSSTVGFLQHQCRVLLSLGLNLSPLV